MVAPSDSAALNRAQRGVLSSHVQDPDSADMTIGVCAVVRPTPDVARLAEATRRAYLESDGTRVLVAQIDGEWRQWVDRDVDPRLIVHDVSGQSDPQAAADRLVGLLTGTRIRLDGSMPLISSHLVVLGPDEARWLFVAHHIIGDGYSGMAFRARVAAWYDHLGGAGSAPEPVTSSVVDSWERAESSNGEDVMARWGAALSELPARLSIADREGRPGLGTRRATVVVGPEPLGSLCQAAEQRKWVYPIVAACAAYTARVTGDSRVVLGFALADRQRSVDKDVVTQLARVVPLVIDVPDGATWTELSASCREALAAAHRLGPITAEELRSAVPAAWRYGRVHGPILNIVPFDAEVVLTGHEVRSRVFNRGPVDDLQIAVAPVEGGIEIDSVANAWAYSADENSRHVARLAQLIAVAGESPRTPVLDLDPSLPDERLARAAYEQRTGCRIVDAVGRDALAGQAGSVVDPDGRPTGRSAMLHPDGTVEDLGTLEDRTVIHGFPVYLERVRRAALDEAGVRSVRAQVRGRRVHVHVTADADTPLTSEAVATRVRQVLPGMVGVRIILEDAEHLGVAPTSQDSSPAG